MVSMSETWHVLEWNKKCQYFIVEGSMRKDSHRIRWKNIIVPTITQAYNILFIPIKN